MFSISESLLPAYSYSRIKDELRNFLLDTTLLEASLGEASIKPGGLGCKPVHGGGRQRAVPAKKGGGSRRDFSSIGQDGISLLQNVLSTVTCARETKSLLAVIRRSDFFFKYHTNVIVFSGLATMLT